MKNLLRFQSIQAQIRSPPLGMYRWNGKGSSTKPQNRLPKTQNSKNYMLDLHSASSATFPAEEHSLLWLNRTQCLLGVLSIFMVFGAMETTEPVYKSASAQDIWSQFVGVMAKSLSNDPRSPSWQFIKEPWARKSSNSGLWHWHCITMTTAIYCFININSYMNIKYTHCKKMG